MEVVLFLAGLLCDRLPEDHVGGGTSSGAVSRRVVEVDQEAQLFPEVMAVGAVVSTSRWSGRVVGTAAPARV